MKVAQLLLTLFVFLAIFSDVFSSNPDSAIVQDNSDNNEGNRSKPNNVRTSDSQPRSVGDTDSGVSIVRVLKPTISGSRIIWREVGISEGIEMLRNRTPFFTVWTNLRSRRPNSNNPSGSRNPNNGIRRWLNNRDRPSNHQNNFPLVSEEEIANSSPYSPSNNDGNEQIFPETPQSNQNNRNEGRFPIIFVERVNPNTILSDSNAPATGTFAYSLSNNGGNSQYSPDIQQSNGQIDRNDERKPFDGRKSSSSSSDSNAPNRRPVTHSIYNNGGNSHRSPEIQPNGQVDSYDRDNRQPNGAQNPNRRSSTNNRDFQVKGGVPDPPVLQASQPPRDIPASNVPAAKPNNKISPDSNFFATIVNNFAFKLINSMNLEENFVISPLSLFIALSMGYLGSDGDTKAQLEQALGLDDNEVHDEHLHKGIKGLMSLIQPGSSDYELLVANGMFLGKNFTPEVKFLEDVQNYYNAEVQNLDFTDPQTISVINNWVAQNTRNMIPNLLDSTPSPRTRLLLLNAVYFKGTWKTQFQVNDTFSGVFHTLDGNEKKVQTMSLSGEKFKVFRSDEHKHTFIKLPYEGDDISMIIALPYSETEVPMSPETDQLLCVVQDSMVDTDLDFFGIPKFRLEHGTSLREPLEQLGINDLFDSFAADLSNLRRRRDVYVSDVFQKAVVDVNEKGTTASAATGMRFVPLTLQGERRILADHPFTFFIVHNPTGLVKFYGKVFDPDQSIPSTQRENPRRRQKLRQNSEIRRNRNR